MLKLNQGHTVMVEGDSSGNMDKNVGDRAVKTNLPVHHPKIHLSLHPQKCFGTPTQKCFSASLPPTFCHISTQIYFFNISPNKCFAMPPSHNVLQILPSHLNCCHPTPTIFWPLQSKNKFAMLPLQKCCHSTPKIFYHPIFQK